MTEILEPSQSINTRYIYCWVETEDDTYSGFLVEQTETEVILRDSANKEFSIPTDKLISIKRQENSLMPEGLLQGLTAQEAADLLEYLYSLSGAK